MDYKETRLKNLRSLMSGFKTKAQFAEFVGINTAYLSQITSKNPTRTVGDDTVAACEKAFHLPKGWLDVSHENDPKEEEILAMYRSFPPHLREVAIAQFHLLVKMQEKHKQ